ncbi:MAG: hypothetical protein Fur0021_29730 [Candidatus Promineifilaceae bacterium]
MHVQNHSILTAKGLLSASAKARLCPNDLPAGIAGEMRETLELLLLAQIQGSWINGAKAERIPNTSSVTIPGVDVDALLLSMPEIMLGVGSACTTGALEPSHVLQAIGLNREDAASTIRFSLGRFNLASEIPFVVDRIVRAVHSS